MKEVNRKFEHKGETYTLVFNLNSMEAIQEEYGTLEAWGALTDGKDGETNIKALVFGFTAMINEGIEIENEDNGTDKPLLSTKKVARIISEIGINNVTSNMNDLVIESAGNDSKNE